MQATDLLTSRLWVVWCIWQLSLIGTAKLCYRTRYQIPWILIVMTVLNEALEKYPHPEIFNIDQGSQYTSEVQTQRLKKTGCCYIYGWQG